VGGGGGDEGSVEYHDLRTGRKLIDTDGDALVVACVNDTLRRFIVFELRAMPPETGGLLRYMREDGTEDSLLVRADGGFHAVADPHLEFADRPAELKLLETYGHEPSTMGGSCVRLRQGRHYLDIPVANDHLDPHSATGSGRIQIVEP